MGHERSNMLAAWQYQRPLCAISGHSKIGFANSGSPNKVKTLSRHRAPLTLKRVHTPLLTD
jgi:hypothetical protein